ncbi:pyroglutamyl-peptidase I [Phascolarctobacterium sp.]|uniref:pyroglutamyl-peptidase I family protein n=1 Tax=Phascolarctobacterium sp. TaxID=2049039 RepID=UPI00386EFAB7
MRKLLVTGFDPFAHYQVNPSWKVVQVLPDVIGDFELHKLMLPNIYDLEDRMLLERAQELQPDVILLTGMDSGSNRLHIDTVAVNVRDALVEDNLGRKPWNEPVVKNGPAAYFSTLPVHEMVRQLQQEGCHVHIGYATGGYVCNDVFYTACHHFAGSNTLVGFVHIPLLPEMVWDEKIALPLEESVATLAKIILCLSQMTAK